MQRWTAPSQARPCSGTTRLSRLPRCAGSASSCWWCSSASTSPSSSRTRRRSIRSSRSIAASTPFGSTSPEAIALMRQSLRELYGLRGRPCRSSTLVFWTRMVLGDFGPSLSAFPTPVSVLIWRALPWTAALLVLSTAARLGARQPAGRPRRLLPRQPPAAPRRRRGDGLPSDPLLHRRLRAADRVRLSLAGAADQRRRADEPAARLRPALHRQRAAARHPAGAVAGAGRPRRLVHGHALAGLQHRHRGLRHLRRTRRRQRGAHPALLRHAQRAGAAGDRPRHLARRHLQRRHHHRAGVRLSRHRHAAGRCRARRRLQPGAGRHHRVDHRGVAGGAADRSRLSAARSAGEGALDGPRAARPAALQPRSSPIGIALLALVVTMSRCCRPSRPIRRTTPTSCRPTCRRPGPILSAPRRAARTCSGC